MKHVGVSLGVAAMCVLLGGFGEPQGIPVEMAVWSPPSRVEAEGRAHLIYELHLTNLGRSDVVVTRIEVMDEDGMVIADYGSANLEENLFRPSPIVAPEDARRLSPGLRAVAFLDVERRVGDAITGPLKHRVTFEPVTTPAAGVQNTLVGAEIPIVPTGMPVGPPLRGDGWVAMHGLSNASTHRRTLLTLDGRTVIAQRFAIDFTRIGSDGQAFRGDPADNRNWTPYGADVLAVADGTIAAVQDGIPENDPTSETRAAPIDLKTVGGNWIILTLPDGRDVFYAHLQPGSLLVRPGDVVSRGQVIGLLGNSGQSDAPHLHIHVVDEPSPLSAEGVPLIFETFDVQGHLASLKPLVDGTGWRASGPRIERHSEMPVENAVIAFPQ